jgi:type VI secretion system secreted protein VgrG
MKETLLLKALRNAAKRIPMSLGLALAVTFLPCHATAQDVNLGTANNFAVLSATGITSTGATVINGNIGATPITGAAITGLTESQVNGTIYTANAAGPAGSVMDSGRLTTAMGDLTTAYNAAAGLTPTRNLTGLDLGGLTLTPGVYSFSSSADLTGTLTLNDQGNPDAVFVFQIGTALTTAGSVVTINDPSSTPGTSVFWQVGSSATLGTGSAFEGNILAADSITLVTGAADLDGRLLTETGAVTLDDNTITAPPAEVIGVEGSVPDTACTLLLLSSALALLFAFGRRFSLLLWSAA